jgi:hypothetical protein
MSSIQFGILALGGAGVCYALGYEGYQTSMKFREPITMSITEFNKKTPQEGWYKITGGVLRTPEAVCMARISRRRSEMSNDYNRCGSATDFYLPLHDPNAPQTDTNVVIILTDPDGSIREAMQAQGADNTQNKSTFTLTKDVGGLLKGNIDSSKISHLTSGIGPNLVYLREGTYPSGVAKSIGLFALGTALLPVSLLLFGVRFGKFGLNLDKDKTDADHYATSTQGWTPPQTTAAPQMPATPETTVSPQASSTVPTVGTRPPGSGLAPMNAPLPENPKTENPFQMD